MTLKVVPLVEFATPMIEPTGKETGTPTPGTPGTPGTEVTLAVTATGCASCSVVNVVASSVSLVNGSDMSGNTATLSDVRFSSISAVLAKARVVPYRRQWRRRMFLAQRLPLDYAIDSMRPICEALQINSLFLIPVNGTFTLYRCSVEIFAKFFYEKILYFTFTVSFTMRVDVYNRRSLTRHCAPSCSSPYGAHFLSNRVVISRLN